VGLSHFPDPVTAAIDAERGLLRAWDVRRFFFYRLYFSVVKENLWLMFDDVEGGGRDGVVDFSGVNK
jgi:hypothetical protein